MRVTTRGRRHLLAWYEPRRRGYPWRVNRSAYRTLVSEFMLQQTQAPRVAEVFVPFVATFPDVRSLAGAPSADVVRAWSGLGYNRRARYLYATASTIVREHAGRVPSDVAALQRLPGVGPYTAAAVASIAFGARVAAVDTNVRRVVARFWLADGDEPPAPSVIRDAAARWLDPHEPGEFNEALMDLGREVCRLRDPRCAACPLQKGCAFARFGADPMRDPASATSARSQPPFEGSFRQVRGAVVRVLARRHEGMSLTELASTTGHGRAEVAVAVDALRTDGLIVVRGRCVLLA